ncbi:ABC transporter ATP-binding protein [Bacilli bacterium]|nr:ABC transporter ATP-binding protein [Bacilli bacterium]
MSASKGDVIAILGPNGAGKSTLLKCIMKHFNVRITKGSINYDSHNLNKMTTDQIAKLGVFYATQNPTELDGVQMLEFLKLVANKNNAKTMPFMQLYSTIQDSLKTLELPTEILTRNVNVGFSGGQKKKNEILQAKLFNPSLILLDEIDSGLDIDAMKIISNFIVKNKPNCVTIVVSHHIEFLKILRPSKVFVLVNGSTAKIGDKNLVKVIEKDGFKNFVTNTSKNEADFEKSDPFLVCRKK